MGNMVRSLSSLLLYQTILRAPVMCWDWVRWLFASYWWFFFFSTRFFSDQTRYHQITEGRASLHCERYAKWSGHVRSRAQMEKSWYSEIPHWFFLQLFFSLRKIEAYSRERWYWGFLLLLLLGIRGMKLYLLVLCVANIFQTFFRTLGGGFRVCFRVWYR